MSEIDPQAQTRAEQSMSETRLSWPIRALARSTTWFASLMTQLDPQPSQPVEVPEADPVYRYIPPSLEKSILGPSHHWEQVDIETNNVPELTKTERNAWGELVNDWYKRDTCRARLGQMAVNAVAFLRSKPSPSHSLSPARANADTPPSPQGPASQAHESEISREILIERLRRANTLACTTSDPRIAEQAEQEAEELRYLLSRLYEQ